MATNKVKDFLTDEEMAALEGGGTTDFISDEEMAKLDATTSQPHQPIGDATAPLKAIGGIIAAPFKEGYNLIKDSPKAIKTIATSPIEFGKGAAKGIANTGLGIINTGLGAINFAATNPWVKEHIKPIDTFKPSNESQKIGSEYGGGAVDAALMVVPIKLGVKGTQLTAQSLKLDKPLEKFATRSQTRQVKINSPEWNMGARPEINAKYGVIGKKAEDAAGQWQALEDQIIENFNPRIANRLNDPKNVTTTTDLRKHAHDVINRSNASQDEKLLQMAEVDNIIGRWDDVYKEGKINILEAQKLKIEQGRQGNWKATGLGRVSNPKAPLEAKAHNAIYDALKVNVENKGSEGIKELNKALSEIIPMKLSAEKRMMVDKRNNFASLDDVVSTVTALATAAHGNFLPAIYAGGNMAVKSPIMAKTAYKTAQAIRGEKIPPGIKNIQDAISLPLKSETGNFATPAYFRKGIKPEIVTPEMRREWENSLINKDRLGNILDDINNPKSKIENPSLDWNLQLNKMVNDIAPNLSPVEKKDFMDYLMEQYPFGDISRKPLRLLPEELYDKLRQFKTRDFYKNQQGTNKPIMP